MMPLRIIDYGFNILAEIDDYQSLVFTRKYNKAGEFELHINMNKNNADKLQKDNIIILGNNSHKVGIIRHREIKVDDNNQQGEQLVVKGSTLSSIIGRRITIPPSDKAYDTFNAAAESVMKHYVDKNCISPADSKRVIDNLILNKDLGRGVPVNWHSRLKQLDEEVEAISNLSELGWEVYIDLNNKEFVFDVVQGRDLRAIQDILPPVIFSIDFDNIRSQQYIDSSIGYKNKGYIGGQGEGENRDIVEVGGAVSGFSRMETFIDAGDLKDGDDLQQKGVEKLKENPEIQTFEAEVLNNTFKYGKDWDVGDVVTVKNKKWNVTLDSRITEVKETYEASGFKLEATFGNNIPTLIDKVKAAIDKPMIETPKEYKNDDRYYTKSEVDVKVNEGNASTFVFTQTAPAATWLITHNMQKYPSVTIVDSSGNAVMGEVTYISSNQVKLTFTAPFSGNAYFN